jgi:hypothetical protein
LLQNWEIGLSALKRTLICWFIGLSKNFTPLSPL